MATTINEIKTYFGRCRCCLEFGYLKNMWTVHHWEGDTEIYGDMIIQCFAFTLEKPDCVDQDQICETCITRLRDAFSFKNLLVKSQKMLQDGLKDGEIVPIKLENIKPETSLAVDSDTANDTQDEIDKEIELDMDEMDEINDTGVPMKEDPVYEQVEYLEDEIVDNPNTNAVTQQPIESDESGPSKRKWPKKLPRNLRNKTYLQYTEDDMRKGIEAVKSQKMTMSEAAEYYNVPRKTLTAKLKNESENFESDPDREERFKFLTEIKTILSYTNVTPYKSRVSRFCCAYCTDEIFDNAEDLRNHTRRVHMDDRTKKVDLMMRPYWMNEILKLDIENLLCVVCCVPLYNWTEMFQHLEEKHDVILDLAYRRVVPYVLGSELKCALCKQVFMNYLQLDGHMNSHYNNYVCVDCGDTFLTGPRLKSHMKIHMVGKFPCPYCDKVFNLQHYRKKHEIVVHSNLNYKCQYCVQKFSREKERNKHMADKHADKMEVFTCDQCGKTLNWRHEFLSHMRKVHGKKFECPDCGKRFFQKCDMDGHIASKHTGEKNFMCVWCHKRYSSRPALAMHLRSHHKNEQQQIT